MCAPAVAKVLHFIGALLVVLCSAFYFWYFALALEPDADGNVRGLEAAVNLISALVLLIIGILGIVVGGVMEKAGFMLFYCICVLLMLILGLLQMVIVAIALGTCTGGELQNDDNPFNSLCILPEDERWVFWFPTITILVCEFFATVAGFIYKKSLADSDPKPKNYY